MIGIGMSSPATSHPGPVQQQPRANVRPSSVVAAVILPRPSSIAIRSPSLTRRSDSSFDPISADVAAPARRADHRGLDAVSSRIEKGATLNADDGVDLAVNFEAIVHLGSHTGIVHVMARQCISCRT